MNITTSPFTSSDLLRIPQVQPEDWGDITPHFVFYINNPAFCSPLKFMQGDQLAGTGCVIFNEKTAWLAHIIVNPEFRSKGLGTRITRELMAVAESRKCTTISLLATPLGEPVYAKLGFRKEEEYLVYKGEVQELEVDPDVFDYTPKDEAEILKLDFIASGEQRSHLLLPKLSTAKVYRNEGKVEGFYIADLGEGLIVSNSGEAGIALTECRLTQKDFVAFPSENFLVQDILSGYDFSQKYQVRRMYIGESLTARTPMMYFARIGGNLG